MIHRSGIRCFAASSSQATLPTDYTKSILKKFILQVLDSVDNEHTRSLTFYLKPSSNESGAPRRVRVIVKRKIESIREILETLGVELPTRPEGTRQPSYTSANSSPLEVATFLDSLLERKDLLRWKSERVVNFNRIREIVGSTLGTKGVELRYSWSAQNNTVLMASLLRLIEEHYSTLHLPWPGMTLVLSPDDCTELPVDSVEGHVKINPADSPLRWLSVFQAVDAETLRAAYEAEAELIELTAWAERRAIAILKSALVESKMSDKNNSSSGDEQWGYSDWTLPRLAHLSIRVCRGYTCSRRNMLIFLRRLRSEQAAFNKSAHAVEGNAVERVRSIASSRASLDKVIIPSSAELSKTTTEPSIQSDIDCALPLEIEVRLEEGHGTRLLQSGVIRVDCRTSSEEFTDLMQSMAQNAVKNAAEYKRRMKRIDQLRQDLEAVLCLTSLEAGPGVDEGSFESCLNRLQIYIHRATTRGDGTGVLSGLRGLRVKIGRFLGTSDDGACVLPWDLFEAGMDFDS